jgi:hypothetical protein
MQGVKVEPYGIIGNIFTEYAFDNDKGRAKRRLNAYFNNYLRSERKSIASVFNKAKKLL